MPFDGFVTKCIAEELNIILKGGRIDKIHQPNRDEIHLLIRNNGLNHRLLICSNAAAPRVHLTYSAKENPERAPMFCMLMRKHIGGGRIVGIAARGFERVVEISVESASEMGDISLKILIAEIMGKHSNVILINENRRIIDSLVHVDIEMSSVREVMPARQYVPPPPQAKLVPGAAAADEIIDKVIHDMEAQPAMNISGALLGAIMGASPHFCREICHMSGVGASAALSDLNSGGIKAVRAALSNVINKSLSEEYAPAIALRNTQTGGYGVPAGMPPDVSGDGAGTSGSVLRDVPAIEYLDFYCWHARSAGAGILRFDTMSGAIDEFYDGRTRAAALAQRKAGLLKHVNSNIARCKKKLAIQQDSVREAAGHNLLKLYGELITANIHNIRSGAAAAHLLNYYDETEGGGYVDVELDETLSPQANAQVYFKRYRKAVSTWKNAGFQAAETLKELQYLESVLQELEMSQNNGEILEIRQELASQNYVFGLRDNNSRKKGKKSAHSGKNPAASEPHIFNSSDGLAIYVGKNNGQNDRLTMKTASSNDIWLHAQNIPGSHVIIKKQQGDIPHTTLLEAASLAAYFSKARMGGNVNVDYTAVRHVRKPSGARPGMVIYDNQRTLSVAPDESLLTRLKSRGDRPLQLE